MAQALGAAGGLEAAMRDALVRLRFGERRISR